MKAKSLMLILVLFMLVGGFSIVPYILQAYFYNPGTSTTNQVQVPDTDIVDYSLTPQQENAILQQGKAIVRLEYGINCEKCLETQTMLEQIVNLKQFKNQLILAEIKSSASDLPKVNIIGFAVENNQLQIGQKFLQGENVTETSIVNSLCSLLLRPPVECALRGV